MKLRQMAPVAALAALAVTTALAAQAPAAAAAQQAGGGAARYLAEHPEILNLTPVQQQRIRKLAAHGDSANAPLRSQMQQLTRGQQLRDMPPAERRRAAPQIRSVMQQMHANDEAELDSVSAVLTPEQANRLETLREDFKARREARRAAMQPRIDSARARAAGRPPRP